MVSGWTDPLQCLRQLIAQGHKDCVLLYSGLRTAYSGRYSFLAFSVADTLEADSLDALADCHAPDALPQWFGHIAYEAYRTHPIATLPDGLNLPRIRFVRYHHVIRFDHETQTIHTFGQPDDAFASCSTQTNATPEITALTCPLSDTDYLNAVNDALEHIRAGNFYQVNLTRKFCATLNEPYNTASAAELFIRLCAISPAPYSAFVAHQGSFILSSSPEMFLRADNDGMLTTRPIKGTAGRHFSATDLHHSHKDRAENLMIVDLMRNDLSQCAQPGSVQVPALFDVDSFATLHHLSSTITAKAKKDATLPDILRATFPPGSMTGAPKQAAMEWIAQQEGYDRGIYSGALGWVNGNSCELSVVIRTMIIQDTQLHFQVGGGIVADSQAENEYQEILTKARAICKVLGIQSLTI